MAITIVGTPQAGSLANGAAVTLTFDVAPAENDVVYVFGGGPIDRAYTPVPTTPGYTTVDSFLTGGPDAALSRKVMGSTPDTNVVLAAGPSVQDSVAFAAIVLRGVDTTTPEDTAPTQAGGTTSTPDFAAITTVTNDALVIALYLASLSAVTSATAPAGYSNYVQATATDTNRALVGLSTKAVAVAGLEDPGPLASITAAPSSWRAFTLAVRPATGGGGGTSPSWARLVNTILQPGRAL